MSAPTKEQVDETLARIEREQGEFRAVGNHNRQIARERIAAYQERRFYVPTETQMRSVVRGSDRQPRRSGIFYGLGLLISILLIAYAILKSI